MSARTLMLQGTASSVGKSLLVAALCRVFQQDGVRVAPFKSQNMALNSFVTADGGEMGRAQVVQAMAAGLAPSVDMNPVLLKPEADNRSQVVVMGRVRGRMGFRDYRALRAELLDVVEAALGRLRARYDLVLIEGAGSPAEVNLRQGEIVNMRIARMAQAPVVLVGDIDRGGVFAHLVGTLELLQQEERQLIKGFLINKFRGDLALLQPGLEFLEQRTSIPVLGVVPFVPDVDLPEEDSVALETRRPPVDGPRDGQQPWGAVPRPPAASTEAAAPAATTHGPLVDIAVVQLPHVSNFDDFDPLGREPGVRVRYVRWAGELERPDLVVLPGTKATIADLRWLEDRGLAAAIVRLVADGTAAIGICGGYQMLGRSIEDPTGAEAAAGDRVGGLGLLPVRTVFEPVKQTHQVRAAVLAETGLLRGSLGEELTGYEIHMGRSVPLETAHTSAGAAFSILSRSGASPAPGSAATDGMLSTDGQILGTYLHGLFENAGLRRALLTHLAAGKGRSAAADQAGWGQLLTLDQRFDRLADVVRASVDVARLYEIAGLRR